MKTLKLIAPLAVLAFASACGETATSPDDNGGSKTTSAEVEGGGPDQPIEIAASENLIRLTCADFLNTAKVAAQQPVDDDALAAQDELANGITWLHGFLYAQAGGDIEVLSQDWMMTTVKRIYERCDAAEDPATTNLFDVARS